MRIGIIACEAFERNLEYLTQGDQDIVYKEYLAFNLHMVPENLKRTVIEKVNGLEGKVDAALLGYGICNSLRDITEQLRVPTVQLVGDDCIGVLLTPEGYDNERKKCAGTFYNTPYFSTQGRDWHEEWLRTDMPDYKENGITVDWFIETLYNGYTRMLFIDDTVGDMDEFIDLSKKFAAELDLSHECTVGTLSLLKDGLGRTKELARAELGRSI